MAERRRHRVLVLIKGLGLGGAERLIADGSARWDRELFEYRVAYLLPWKDHLVADLRSRHVPTVCIGGRRGLDPAIWARLRSLVSDWGPDLIHAHLPSTGILARVATNVPCVYTEHNIVTSYRRPVRLLNRLTYSRNRAVVAVSEAVAASLAGYPGPTPIVIHNGVTWELDRGAVSAVRPELGIDAETPLVVHVGNIRPFKGHPNLVAAAAELRRLHPGVVVVSIGGEKNPGDLDRMRSLAGQSGVGDMVHFLGRRDDASAFLAAADVVVSPSQAEGLPLSVLEALALARPVVATAVGGVPSVVIHEETGLLIPPEDPSALAGAIHRALTDPAAARWAETGSALVRREHGLDTMVRAYEKLYLELLA